MLPERTICTTRQLDGLRYLSVEEMEVVDLGEDGVILDTSLRVDLLKVAVSLDGIFGGSQVRVDGVSAACSCWVLQLHIQAGTGHPGVGDCVQILLHLCQLNIQELLQEEKVQEEKVF